MKFDKTKILTVVTADQAIACKKGWFSDDITSLKIYIERGDKPKGLQSVDFHNEYPFRESYPSDGSFACKYRYFYPAPEPTYRPFHDDELNDIVGKVVVQNHTGNAMLIIKIVDSETGKVVSLGGSQKRNSQQLLDGWAFKDGHPCGVKEEI